MEVVVQRGDVLAGDRLTARAAGGRVQAEEILFAQRHSVLLVESLFAERSAAFAAQEVIFVELLAQRIDATLQSPLNSMQFEENSHL